MPKLSKFKVVLVGDQNVGKTSVISRFIQDSFQATSNPTVGIDFVTKTMQVQGQTLRLQLWDTAGQQRFRSLIPSYVRDADCCLIVLDLSTKSSFEGIDKWYEFVRQQRGQDGLIFFVGNKVDVQERQVKQKDMQTYAQQNGHYYIEVSAKTGTNISSLFRKVAQKLIQIKNGPTQPEAEKTINKEPIVLKQQNKAVKKNSQQCGC